MNIDNAFGSYLKADHLPEGRDVPVTIESVVMEEIQGEAKPKAVMYMSGKDRGLVLNRTNADTIKELYGAETDAWRGQPIVLYKTTTQYGGKTVPAIRVRSSLELAVAQRSSAPVPAPAPVATPVDTPEAATPVPHAHAPVSDDDIPF